MSTINCTFEEFKKAYKEFHDQLPSLNLEEAENAFKCLTLYYFGMTEEKFEYSCYFLFEKAMKSYQDHTSSLLFGSLI